jgi:hypothetical protein
MFLVSAFLLWCQNSTVLKYYGAKILQCQNTAVPKYRQAALHSNTTLLNKALVATFNVLFVNT